MKFQDDIPSIPDVNLKDHFLLVFGLIRCKMLMKIVITQN